MIHQRNEDSRDPVGELFERRLEEYLGRLASGERPDLEAHAGAFDHPVQRRGFRVAALAEEYMLRAAEGAAVRASAYRDRLVDEGERREFDQYVLDSRRAGRFLPSSLAPGTSVGKYTIERELGRGGTAVVYSALDNDLARKVAIKVVNKRSSSAQDHDRWEEIVRTESRTLAALKSRNIVTVYEVERGTDSSYIVMDLIPGTSAAQVIKRLRDAGGGRKRAGRVELLRELLGPKPPGGDYEDILDAKSWYLTVTRIVGKMVEAVERAHERGIHHRDLKPGNVMLLGGGEPVLLDFGMAATSEMSDEDEGLHGTPGYLAPEQVRSFETGRDERTDLYKLGLILYELLTLRPAFEHVLGEPITPLLGRIAEGAYEAPSRIDPHVPAALEAICRMALAPDLDQRYAKAAELRVDLERFERGLPPRYARIPAGAELRLRVARVVRNRWTAMTALLVAVVLGSWLLLSDPWAPPALQPFGVAESASAADLLRSGQVLTYPGAFALGVEVSASSPTVLYAFSVFGGANPEDLYVRAVTPERYGSLELPPDDGPQPLRVEPGVHRITCSFVTEAPSKQEGILVYACEKESPLVAAWQDRIWRREVESEGLFPMTWTEAMELGQTLLGEGGRGESGARVDAAQRRNLFANLSDAGVEPGPGWKELGFKRELFTFEVAGR